MFLRNFAIVVELCYGTVHVQICTGEHIKANGRQSWVLMLSNSPRVLQDAFSCIRNAILTMNAISVRKVLCLENNSGRTL